MKSNKNKSEIKKQRYTYEEYRSRYLPKNDESEKLHVSSPVELGKRVADKSLEGFRERLSRIDL